MIIKNFSDVDTFDCLVKNSPAINFNNYNYLSISNFAGLETAYYFITSREIREHNCLSLNLKLDVLETYKTDILNSKAIVTREAINDQNKMFPTSFEGNLLPTYSTIVRPFQTQLPTNTKTKILITVGGVS